MNKKSWIVAPYILWALVFTIIPSFIVLVYSFVKRDPYGGVIFEFTLDNYKTFFEPIYLNVLWRSIRLSVYSTVACLAISYPMAYFISKSKHRRNILVMLVVLPLWTNFLLRTYAWMVVLRDQGVVNELLIFLGIIDEPMKLLYTNGAVVMGMVYNFIPFMVLPIYTVLSKIDNSLIEASQDLGANRREVFTKVIFPLSLPGVVSGIIMVFLPAISTFVISDLLGGGQTILLGNLIQNQYMMARNWQFGSAISMIMMIMIIIAMGFMNKYSSKDGGRGLW